ncbi:ubiquitin carboxyl-terminal hydrolase 50-like [Dysidea avara]|uniref:ubiquitin carboxyl-terminal hydrolase 50-like n=1 Tax=Dysidea avara TaxID=196820 RepID=UPI003330B44C
MSPYVVGDQQPRKYHLYAITNHTGTLHGGHYTACCRHPYNRNKFYKSDDQEVYEIGSSKLQTAAGYVLFYTSVDFVPPKLGT